MALDSVMKRFGTLRRNMTKKLNGEIKEHPRPPMPQSRTAQLRLANTFDSETDVGTCISFAPAPRQKAQMNKSSESVKAMNESRDTILSTKSGNLNSSHSKLSNGDKPKPKPRPQARPDRPGSVPVVSSNSASEGIDAAVEAESESERTNAISSANTSATGEHHSTDSAPARPPKKPTQKPPPPARKRGNSLTPAPTASTMKNSVVNNPKFAAGTMPGRPTNAPKTRVSASNVFSTVAQDSAPSRPPPKGVTCAALWAKVDDLKERAECYNISIGKELRGMRSLSTSGVNGLTVEDNRLRKITAAMLALGKLAELFNTTITSELDRCAHTKTVLKDASGEIVSPDNVAKQLLNSWRTCLMGLEFVHSLEHKTSNMSDTRGEMAHKDLMKVFGENTRLPEALM